MHNPIDPFTPAFELRGRRADYGIDAPLSGLLPPSVGGLTLAALSAYHHGHGRRALASIELLSGVPMLFTAAVYRRLQAVSEAARVLKPSGRLLITDLLWTRRYAQHLRQLGMQHVEQRSLGWRFWYAPFLGADLVTATKPPAT